MTGLILEKAPYEQAEQCAWDIAAYDVFERLAFAIQNYSNAYPNVFPLIEIVDISGAFE